MKKIVCWFSCGAPSAVAAKLAIAEVGHENLQVVYQDTGSEHSDNKRFLSDVEDWLQHEVIIIRSDKYADIWEVFQKERYLCGVAGARCTSELKRKVAERFLNLPNGETEVLGYSIEERGRVARFIENNPERTLWPILIERNLNKGDCLGILASAKIEIPKMYKMGYRNNNCIGCVKGGAGYWNKIRVDFPEVFARMAAQERDLNVAINKRYDGPKRIRVFLDELDPNAGNYRSEPSISCGLFCQIENDRLLTPKKPVRQKAAGE